MPVIVISGMPGAGSSTIAKLMAKKLRLKHFSAGDYFKKTAEQMLRGKNNKETESAVEFMETEVGSSKSFHKKLDEHQKKIAEKGNIVIDSKLGIAMLKNLSDFSVWLKASTIIRAKRVSGRDNIPIKEAQKLIKKKDKLERKQFKKIYGFDYFTQEKQAGVVINTGNKTPEEIVDIILLKMKKLGS